MSAEKVAALEALLSRVQERRDEPGAHLHLAFDAAAPAAAPTATEARPATATRPATASSAVAQPPHAPSTRRLGGAVDQSIPQPTAPDEPPLSTEQQQPRESAPEIVMDDAPAVEIDEAELAELTAEEAAELAQLDEEAADVEIVEDELSDASETDPAPPRAEEPSEERAIEPPTMPRPDLRAAPDDGPSSEVITEPRPEPVTQQRPPISDDGTPPSAAGPSEGETTTFDRDQVTPPPLPPQPAPQPAPQPDASARPGPTLASGEVLVEPPASPEPAPTLQVGDMVVKPRRVEPQILLKDNVGEFIAEVRKVSSASFGEVLDSSLDLGVE